MKLWVVPPNSNQAASQNSCSENTEFLYNENKSVKGTELPSTATSADLLHAALKHKTFETAFWDGFNIFHNFSPCNQPGSPFLHN